MWSQVLLWRVFKTIWPLIPVRVNSSCGRGIINEMRGIPCLWRSFTTYIWTSKPYSEPIISVREHHYYNRQIRICRFSNGISAGTVRLPCDCILILFTFTRFIGPSRLSVTKYDMKTTCFSDQNGFSIKNLDQVLSRQNFKTFFRQSLKSLRLKSYLSTTDAITCGRLITRSI